MLSSSAKTAEKAHSRQAAEVIKVCFHAVQALSKHHPSLVQAGPFSVQAREWCMSKPVRVCRFGGTRSPPKCPSYNIKNEEDRKTYPDLRTDPSLLEFYQQLLINFEFYQTRVTCDVNPCIPRVACATVFTRHRRPQSWNGVAAFHWKAAAASLPPTWQIVTWDLSLPESGRLRSK